VDGCGHRHYSARGRGGYVFGDPQVRVFKEFSTTEISTSITPVVPITEAGLFVDIFPVSANGGTDDSAVGFEDTTLSRLVQFNAPVAYKQFDVINKTQDFNLEIRWEFRF
jgi:hypothetical protein